MLTLEELRQLSGRTMLGADGQDLGTIQDLYADRSDDDPTFATVVDVDGGLAWVPLAEAVLRGSDVVVPYDEALVNTAPWVAEDASLSAEEEQELYAHYGLDVGEATVAMPAPVALPTAEEPLVPPPAPAPALVRGSTRFEEPAEPTPPVAQVAGAAQEAAGETASTAKDEAAQTARAATAAAADVAGTAKAQAGVVAGEAVNQVRQLTEQAREQATAQADTATRKLSDTVRSLAGEVRDLGEGRSDGSGTVAGLAQQLATRGDQVADYLAQSGPTGLLDDVRRFAARRPGTFLLGALAAGVATGRLVKGATDDAAEDRSSSSSSYDASPAVVPVVPVVVDDARPDVPYVGPASGDQRLVDGSFAPASPEPRRSRR